jgi:hypothetical protein
MQPLKEPMSRNLQEDGHHYFFVVGQRMLRRYFYAVVVALEGGHPATTAASWNLPRFYRCFLLDTSKKAPRI